MDFTPFNKPLLTGDELYSLIPQRPPIVMVDSFYGVDGDYSYSGLEIKESNLFCTDGFFDECGITEHIAQSGAARVGYIYSTRKEPIPVGFIGSVDKMTYHTLPRTGDYLRTVLKVEQEIFDITLISAQVYAGEEIIAEGLLKIFLNKEV